MRFAAGEALRVGADMIWMDVDAGTIGRFAGEISPDIIRLVDQSPDLDPGDLPLIAKALPERLGSLPLPKPVPVKQVTRVAKTRSQGWYREPVLSLPTLTLLFDYDGTDVDFGDFTPPNSSAAMR